MDDPLAPFREGERARDAEVETTCERDLLLFEHGGVAYAVPASSVDVVVAWNPPAPLPASVPGFAGVLQDRGRVVAILTSPLAAARGETEERRIVICSTRRGFIGLPCVRTSDVGPVRLAAAPVPGEVVDSSRGPVVFVDPELLVDELSVGGPRVSARDQFDVLVIDDSDIARAAMVRALGKAGLQVLDLPSPIGATRSIVRHDVRLVVIDINMPSMRGDKLAALFRSNDRLRELKLVLVSGTEPERLSELAAEVGADGVVAKAAGGEALVAMVRQLIEVRRR